MSEAAQASSAPIDAAPAPQSEAPVENLEATSSEEGISDPESSEDLEQQMEEKGLSEKEKKSLRKKYQLKVNNKVKELELDLGNDEEVQKYLQKALASEEKFQEAANIRKGFAELINAIKTNPLAVLSHPDIGVNIKELAEQVMAKEIEDMQKSPEQKRIEELERALKEREEREKELEEQKRAAELAKIEEEVYQDLDNQITNALSKSDLPKSPYFVKRLADAVYSAMEMGYKDVTVEQILPFVEQQITQELNEIFETAPEQTMEKLLEKYVGKKNIDKYRKVKLSKSKAKPVSGVKEIKDTGSTSSAPKADDVEIVSVKSLLGF